MSTFTIITRTPAYIKSLIFIACLLAFRSAGLTQANVSHNANSIPVAGTFNTGIGVTPLLSNTSGNNNVGAGYHALRSNTTGSFNTGIGNFALFSNLTSSNNTATGHRALYNN